MKKVTLAIAMAALVLLAGCKKDKETVVEKNKIVMGAPTISGTKAAINSLNDLKASGLEIDVDVLEVISSFLARKCLAGQAGVFFAQAQGI